MKKTLLLVCCALFLCTAHGQYSVVVSEQSIYGTALHSIIKEYKYPSTITCILSEDSSSTFIYADQFMQTKEFKVPNLLVNDMIINVGSANGREDTVFFCGKDLETGKATLGFFNVYNAFNSSGPVYLHDPFLSGENNIYIKTLTRMVSFIEGVNKHIVCIGENFNNKASMVEVVFGPSYSLVSYRAGSLYQSDEKFFDIGTARHWTDNYIVTAGMDFFMGNKYLNLRVYDINDIFAPSGIQDWKHIFCIDTSFGFPWNRDDVLIRSFDDGLFATVSYIDEGLYNGNAYGSRPVQFPNSVHLGVYKVTDLVSNSVSSMIRSAVFEPLPLVHNSLMRFIYGSNRTLTFLENIQDGSGNETSSFCEIGLNSSSYVSTVNKSSARGDIYTGMDSYNLYNNYILSGFEDSDRTMLKYSMETVNVVRTCHSPEKYEYIQYNPYRSVNMVNKFVQKSKRSSFKEIVVESAQVPLTIECEK